MRESSFFVKGRAAGSPFAHVVNKFSRPRSATLAGSYGNGCDQISAEALGIEPRARPGRRRWPLPGADSGDDGRDLSTPVRKYGDAPRSPLGRPGKARD